MVFGLKFKKLSVNSSELYKFAYSNIIICILHNLIRYTKYKVIRKMGIKNMKIKIVNKSKHPLPNYATALAAGMDLRANLSEPVELFPLERSLIPTGLFIQLPEGYEAQIRPRSGLAVKHGISIVNAPGTIDADYRGEIRVVLVNLSNEIFTINDGERICQMVISKHEKVDWSEVEVLDETERGNGGFGHTGKI